jgi:NADH:ubiquinone oxidoreductase subunit 5 (subunit L)/multisubunit Na+/H+ antiporter MnhA subunit
VARDKFYVDEIYEGLFVVPMEATARFLAGPVDAGAIDRTLSSTAPAVAGWLSSALSAFQNGNTQRYAVALFAGTVGFVVYLTLFVLR